MQKDCYTCCWAVCTVRGVICSNIWYDFHVDKLLGTVAFPCDGWEREQRKLVNEHERTI